MPWIHLQDQIGLIDFLLCQPQASGPYNACAPQPVRNAEFARALGRTLCIAGKAPGVAFCRDPAPYGTLLWWLHGGPHLHFVEAAATTLAFLVALAGGADGDAGRIGGRVVPGQPGCHGVRGKALNLHFGLMPEDHQRVHLGQGPYFGLQQHTIRGRVALSPVVDGGFDIGDVQCGHGRARGRDSDDKAHASPRPGTAATLHQLQGCYE